MAASETTIEEVANEPAEAPRRAPDWTRYRRWHAASGAIPLALFLVEHLATNASALAGDEAFDRVVGTLARSSVLPFVEVVFILVPLFFHAGYGVWLARQRLPADDASHYASRNRRLLQRASGVVVLLFVLGHLWELRVQKLLYGLSGSAFHTRLAEHLAWTSGGVPWIAFGYLIGIGAATFHFANGLMAAARVWNIAQAPQAARRLTVLVAALGITLFALGAMTVASLSTGIRLAGDDETKPGPCGSLVPSARVAPPPPGKP